jgi:NAD(P)-dependent dehydrogenase (short-subunit alcohol dehydrogenase family)
MKESNNFSLEGKTAYILGSSGLIGNDVSLQMAKSGCKVILLDNDIKSSKKTLSTVKEFSNDSKEAYFDCSDMENLEKNFNSIIKKFSVPDIFINCSYPRTKDWASSSFKEIKLKSFRKNIDIHLNSYSWLSKLMADCMQSSNTAGSIILTGSIYGHRGQDLSLYKGANLEENMVYPVIKSGILNLVRQMASYYGKDKIRINCVSPGGLEGPIAGKKENQDNKFKKKYKEKTPLGRMAKPIDVSNAMIFLASDASSYITGQSINVDGGISIV